VASAFRSEVPAKVLREDQREDESLSPHQAEKTRDAKDGETLFTLFTNTSSEKSFNGVDQWLMNLASGMSLEGRLN